MPLVRAALCAVDSRCYGGVSADPPQPRHKLRCGVDLGCYGGRLRSSVRRNNLSTAQHPPQQPAENSHKMGAYGGTKEPSVASRMDALRSRNVWRAAKRRRQASLVGREVRTAISHATFAARVFRTAENSAPISKRPRGTFNTQQARSTPTPGAAHQPKHTNAPALPRRQLTRHPSPQLLPALNNPIQQPSMRR